MTDVLVPLIIPGTHGHSKAHPDPTPTLSTRARASTIVQPVGAVYVLPDHDPPLGVVCPVWKEQVHRLPVPPGAQGLSVPKSVRTRRSPDPRWSPERAVR